METAINLSISRRRFLGIGVAAACAMYFPEAALSAPAMSEAEQARRKVEFSSMCLGIAQYYLSRLGAETARAVARDCDAAFQAILPQLPYIGGSANRNQDYLVEAAWLIAMSKGGKAHGLQAEDAGRLLYDLYERTLAATPPDELHRRAEAYFSTENYAYYRQWTEQTQRRLYPEDWVATAVYGNGDDFDIGHDYSQCGAVKLFRMQGEEDVAPYFCLTDFLSSRYEGTGLRRVHTIAQGDGLCDFRYKKGRPVTQSWDTEVPRFPRKA